MSENSWAVPRDKALSRDAYFRSKLPESMYYSHYELHNLYPTYSPDEWREYLREQHKFIQSELALITEAQARSALARLGTSNQDTSALRELLSKSKMITDSQGKRETIVFSFIPPTLPKQEMPAPKVEKDEFMEAASRW